MPEYAPALPSRGAVCDVEIEKVVFGGDGIARLAEGFVLFVPFSGEKECLRVQVVEKKAGHGRAEITEILQVSPERSIPPCPYYARCGGCRYQHLTYAEECRLKEAQVRELFSRIGKLPAAPVLPIITSPADYGYRNRITVHAEAGKIGFRGVDAREMVDIERCLLANDSVNAQLTRLRASRPAPGHYSLRDAGVPPSGFFQANQELQETLRERVLAALPASGPMLMEGYCGGGFFTERAAARFERVVAIDNDPRTLRDARRRTLPNVTWEENDAAMALPPLLRAWAGRKATVLLDPPREGLPAALSAALVATPAAHLVYLSCDPATLARDARVLSGAYRLQSVQPIDLFPRTAQIECLSIWQAA